MVTIEVQVFLCVNFKMSAICDFFVPYSSLMNINNDH